MITLKFLKRFEKHHKSLIFSIIFLIVTAGILFIMENIAPGSFGEITGMAWTKVNVTQANFTVCTFSLEPGWNLVSFHCVPSGLPRNYALDSIASTYDYIFAYESRYDEWYAYNPSLPSHYTQNLNYVSRDQGYWLYMDQSDVFFYNGTRKIDNEIKLFSGWNHVGYPTPNEKIINESLESIEDNCVVIRMYNASSSQWLHYNCTSGLGNLNYTFPDYGYWIYMWVDMSGTDTWVINW